MATQELLSPQQHGEYIEDISKIMGNLIDSLIENADKHHLDRDNALEHFSALFRNLVQISSFKGWEND